MHIAFLDTNTDESEFGRSHPPECAKFQTLLRQHAPDWRYSDFNVSAGEFPDGIGGYDGIMISGSVASVNDPAPWVARLLDLITDAVDQNIPVFGACFGHQAIAKALGGTVGKNPSGWILGRYETLNHTPAPWMDHAGPMALIAAHKEQVLVPPEGAVVHAGTDAVPNGHISIGPRVFSTQYHPELSSGFMAGLLAELTGDVDQTVLDTARDGLGGPVQDDQMARWIVGFFNQARVCDV